MSALSYALHCSAWIGAARIASIFKLLAIAESVKAQVLPQWSVTSSSTSVTKCHRRAKCWWWHMWVWWCCMAIIQRIEPTLVCLVEIKRPLEIIRKTILMYVSSVNTVKIIELWIKRIDSKSSLVYDSKELIWKWCRLLCHVLPNVSNYFYWITLNSWYIHENDNTACFMFGCSLYTPNVITPFNQSSCWPKKN